MSHSSGRVYSLTAKLAHGAICVLLAARGATMVAGSAESSGFVVAALLVSLAAGVVVWRGSRWRDAWLVVTVFALAVVLVEGGVRWYAARPEPWPVIHEPNPRNDPDYFRSDAVLGYSLTPGKSAPSRVYDNEGTIYDVTYHVDPHGIRLTPASAVSGPVVAFFGCSFMFGEGLNDDETLPNAFALATGSRFRVLNLALNGYGPHQMLRAVEVGRYDSLLVPPVAFVYLAVSWQAERSAGRTGWDPAGPRYVRDGNTVRFVGTFGETASFVSRLLKETALGGLVPALRSADLDLYVGIMQRTDSLLRQRYGVGLTALYVKEPSYESNLLRTGWSDDSLANALRAAGITVLNGETPAPASDAPHQYRFRRDGHPTALANRARVDTLLRHLTLPTGR